MIESDGPRLRGLDPGYTQILINGEQRAGPEPRPFVLPRPHPGRADRAASRSSARSSARRTGDAVAGTLNIVLRDALALDGGYVKGGGLLFDDGELKPTAGLYYGGALGPGRVLARRQRAGPLQSEAEGQLPLRRSARRTTRTTRPRTSPTAKTRAISATAPTTRSTAATRSIATPPSSRSAATTCCTDRTETERSFEYNVATGTPGPVALDDDEEPGLLTDAHQLEDIDQENWAIAAKICARVVARQDLVQGRLRARSTTTSTRPKPKSTFDTGEEGDLEDPEWESAADRRRATRTRN